MLSKEEILLADDKRYLDLDVPEWGGAIRIKTMTAREREAFQASVSNKGRIAEDFMERLLVYVLVDQDGKQVFKVEDMEALGKKSSVAIGRIFAKAAELNGMTDKSLDDIKGE